jgi:hypothetical protein
VHVFLPRPGIKGRNDDKWMNIKRTKTIPVCLISDNNFVKEKGKILKI